MHPAWPGWNCFKLVYSLGHDQCQLRGGGVHPLVISARSNGFTQILPGAAAQRMGSARGHCKSRLVACVWWSNGFMQVLHAARSPRMGSVRGHCKSRHCRSLHLLLPRMPATGCTVRAQASAPACRTHRKCWSTYMAPHRAPSAWAASASSTVPPACLQECSVVSTVPPPQSRIHTVSPARKWEHLMSGLRPS